MGVKKIKIEPEQQVLEHVKNHHEYKVDLEKGWIALCRKNGQEFKQYHFLLSEITEDVVREFLNGNFFFSQNTFWIPHRKVENIRQLRSLYVDIDCYTMGLTPEYVADQILNELKGKFPVPNKIIFSGQGLVPVWDIEPAPKGALPLWQVLIHYLVNIFKPYGADLHATDAARIFRADGSVNQKNGATVKVSYIHEERQTLDWWKENYLPEIDEHKKKKNEGQTKGRPKEIVRLYNAYTLHHARFQDLNTLVGLRDGYMPQMREIACFLYRYWMCDFTKDPETALAATLDFNDRLKPRLSREEVEKATLSAEKMFYFKMSEEARKIARETGFPDAGYNYTNKKLIKLLNITKDEMKHLKTIIDKEEKQRRDTEKKRKERGSVTREEYLSPLEERKQIGMQLKAQGYKYNQIAFELNVSINTVKGWFRKKKQG